MKKLVLYIIYLSLGLFLASCAKEFIMQDEASGTIEIEATHEGWNSRTSVDGETGRVYWSPSDSISVFFSEAGVKFISQNREKAGSASFIGNAPSGISGMKMDYIYGLYPYDAQARFDGQSLKTSMPSEQEAEEGTFADGTFITVAKAPRTSHSLGFYNICGGIRFQVPVEGVQYVTLKGNGGETLAGNISVSFTETGVPEVSDVSDTKTEITLTADGGFKPGVWYYIVTVPVNLSQGFTLSFSNGYEVCTYEKTDPVTISRSVFGSLDFSGFEPEWTPEAIVIPDQAFLNYCLDNFDLNGDGVLSVAEAENVYSIDVETSDIHSLKGIEKFANLEYLYCYGSQDYDYNTYETIYTGKLESLDVSKNTELRYLDCSYNNLTSLDVSSLQNLYRLECYGNKLTSLTIGKNDSLDELDCSSNMLEDIDVSGCISLTRLSLSGNKVKTIDLKKNSNLRDLEANYNELTSLDLSGNPSLVYLSCEGNAISALDLSYTSSLKNISCSDNQLTSLDVSDNPSLESLSCFYNNIGVLDVSNNTKLKNISAGANQISSLDVSDCLDLQTLQINGNPIPEIDLSNNSKLVTLSISSVTVLDCSMFPDLADLNCCGCPLESLDLSNNANLRNFYYYDCPLESLDVSKNLNLRYFGSSGNKLRTIWIPAADFPYSYFYHDDGVAVLPKIDDASADSNESFTIDSEQEWD